MMKTIIVVVVIFAVIALGEFYALSLNGDDDSSNKTTTTTISDDSEIRISLADISNSAEFYNYDYEGVTIGYFAVLGPDGDVHVALDACDVCYGAKKGYRQEGNNMHCINCGREFSINSIGTDNTAGGCWPSYIPINVDGDDIVITISDFEAKQYMFA